MTTERWRQVEELFHAAVEKAAAERERFLAEACDSDESLKREVESLLRGDEEAANFTDGPAAPGWMELDKLTPGERLGPYEVSTMIGRGGMGEVYRARDTRLGRDVAIKVLLSLLAADPDRLRRLQLEARTAGMLNHPNILSIYDTGVHGGSPYLVTELLTGKTLRELLNGGALPTRKAIDVASQITRGLAAAHEKGIVHRDLKPENIFVTRDGARVKILDFGLAKVTGPVSGGGSDSAAAIVSGRTGTGVVVGTAGYMSPEQVRGERVDHRSDVFAFGAILYELLTGRRAFQRDSAVETMHAVLKDEPPGPGPELRVSPSVDRIVKRCLEKRPEDRFQSALDVGFALDAVSAPSGLEAVTGVARPARRWAVVVTAAAAAGLAAVLAVILTLRATRTKTPSFQRLSFRRGTISSARFSPDGQTVVYAGAFAGGPTALFATRPGSPESRPFELPEAEVLAISSTGEMAIRLERDWTLARVPLLGGAAREVARGVRSADWSPDGTALAVTRDETNVFRLEYPIGSVLYESASQLSSVRVSPDGKSVAFLENSAARYTMLKQVCVLQGGKKRVLAADAGPQGTLGWTHRGELVYMSFSFQGEASSLRAIAPGGTRRTLLTLDGIVRLFDLDRNGRALVLRDDERTQILLRAPGEAGERELSWLDSSHTGDLSDDGQHLLLVEDGFGSGAERSTYLRKTDGSPAVHLGKGGGLALSPDGVWALVLEPGPKPVLRLVPTGAGPPARVATEPIQDLETAAFFPDGKRILVVGSEPSRGVRLYVKELREGSGPPLPITPEGTNVALCAKPVAPDGGAVAAMRRGGIAVYPLDGGAPREVVGLEPRESLLRFGANGNILFTRIWGVPTRIFKIDLATGKRELWRTLQPADPAGVRAILSIVLTPDGGTYAYTLERVLSELYLVDVGP